MQQLVKVADIFWISAVLVFLNCFNDHLMFENLPESPMGGGFYQIW